MKRHRWCMLIHWTDHYVVETYAMTSKYYLAQSYM